MSEPRYQSAAEILDGWRDDIVSGTPPTLYPVGEGELSRVEIGPGLVTLFGGASGRKDGAVQQLITNALKLTPGLKALICNVEMPPGVLLDRQLARLADLDLTLIRHRRLSAEHSERLDRGLHALEKVSGRLAFVRPRSAWTTSPRPPTPSRPISSCSTTSNASAHRASTATGEARVDASMNYLRQFADAGTAIVVVAALSRSKDSKGRSSYGEGLSLASFRESSELEYGADDAFILTPADDEAEDSPIARVVLRHLKSRHGEAKDVTLDFDRKHQRFTPTGPIISKAETGKLQAALAVRWASTCPAPDDREEW